MLVPPHRVRPVYDLLAHHLFTSAHIQLNTGKARVWNREGTPPPEMAALGPDVWVGSHSQPAEAQGLMILGTPLGSHQYQQHRLAELTTQHSQLLTRIPDLEGMQASWFLLLYCASPRCNYQLRMLPPETTARFAENHDVAVAVSLTRLLDTAPLTAQALPLHLEGLGLTPATATATPAYRASWADTVRVLHEHAPQQASAIQRQFSHPNEATPTVRAAAHCAEHLRQTGHN